MEWSAFLNGDAPIRLITKEVSLGKIHRGIADPIVSPDSKQVAYVAERDGKKVVVVDGIKGKEYDAVMVGDAFFSPDSKRIAYGARRGRYYFVVVDGIEGKKYNAPLPGSKVIFDDSSELLHTLVLQKKKILRIELEVAYLDKNIDK